MERVHREPPLLVENQNRGLAQSFRLPPFEQQEYTQQERCRPGSCLTSATARRPRVRPWCRGRCRSRFCRPSCRSTSSRVHPPPRISTTPATRRTRTRTAQPRARTTLTRRIWSLCPPPRRSRPRPRPRPSTSTRTRPTRPRSRRSRPRKRRSRWTLPRARTRLRRRSRRSRRTPMRTRRRRAHPPSTASSAPYRPLAPRRRHPPSTSPTSAQSAPRRRRPPPPPRTMSRRWTSCSHSKAEDSLLTQGAIATATRRWRAARAS